MSRSIWLVLMAGAIASAAPATELDVTRVVLYKHGVGYFERGGDVPAGEQATLQFRPDEMNDVLKSLSIEQTGGEGVAAVRYDSSDPLHKRLEVFPFQIASHISLAALLDQFRGAEIELTLAGGSLRGVIVSARTIAALEGKPEEQRLMLLVGGGLRTVDPEAASELRFVEPLLQSQFEEYLGVVARSRNTDRRTVTIESRGGASRVVASYVAPTPVWKSSYRLILDEGQPLLEGWAIVDNTSGEDWEDVRLSLVSGLPVSFVTRLYEPKYVERPTFELAQDRAWRPRLHGGAVEEAESAAMGAGIGGAPLRAEMSPPPPAPEARQRLTAKSQDTFVARFERQGMASNLASTAEAADLGDLFEYRIEGPVTIRKSESAMLPFFRGPVEGRRVVIYDESAGSQHPLRAVEVTNSSGATLDGGAITVYEDGAYAGEAIMETLPQADERLVSYAVDLGTRITTAYDSSNELERELHVRRGVLTLRRAQREIKTFTIRNVDPRAKTVVLEHAVRPDYTLVSPEPAEKTASAYRFETEIEPQATKKLAVVEENVYDETYMLSNVDSNLLATLIQNRRLDAAGRQQLERLAELQRQIAQSSEEEQRLERRIGELTQDQQRLRENIATLRNVAGQQERVMQYSEELAAREAQIVELRDQQQDARDRRASLERELDAAIESMEF